jgi:hypothetical protein
MFEDALEDFRAGKIEDALYQCARSTMRCAVCDRPCVTRFEFLAPLNLDHPDPLLLLTGLHGRRGVTEQTAILLLISSLLNVSCCHSR